MGPEQGFFPGKGPFCPHPYLRKHIRYAVAGIEIVVHHQRPAIFQGWDILRFLCPGMEPERKGKADLRACPLLALYLDGPVHHVHNIFRNCHPKAGPLDSAVGAAPLPLERLKNSGHKFLAHANPRILNIKHVIPIPAGGAWFFHYPHTDNAPCARIFHRIA